MSLVYAYGVALNTDKSASMAPPKTSLTPETLTCGPSRQIVVMSMWLFQPSDHELCQCLIIIINNPVSGRPNNQNYGGDHPEVFASIRWLIEATTEE